MIVDWMHTGQGRDYYYRHKGDQRYTLRRVREPSGQTRRMVWALCLGDTRIWEVHGLTNLRIVASDAQDYITSARMAWREAPKCTVIRKTKSA